MSAPTVPTPWKPKYNPWVVALTVTLATFMEVLDTSIANVALPHIAGGLGATPNEAAWVLTSYLVANAIVLPVSAWLSVMMGRKRFYMSCVVIFTASSFLCGFAPTLGTLVLFRILQGLGGGGLATSEQAILADIFAPEKRGMAFAVYGMAVVLAPAIGPTLGGYITDNFSWRWIFYINIPVGLLSLYLTRKIVEDPPYLAKERDKIIGNKLDLMGLGLVTLGVGFLQYVFDKGQEDDWFASKTITTLTVAGIVMVVLFIIQELRHENPILDLRLLKSRNFGMAAFLMFILGMVLFGTTVLIPQFLQVLMGYDAQTAGMALSSGALVMIMMMPIVGRLVGKVDARYLAAFGFSVTALALYHMTVLNLQIDFKTAALMRVYQTIGLAFIFIPINTLSYVGMQPNKSNQIAGITNLARNLGGSIGISLLGTFVARFSQQHQTYMTAHMTPADPAFTQRLAGITQNFIRQGLSNTEATQRAYAVLARITGGQALTMAYVDIVSVMALGVACLIPIIFFMKKPSRRPAPAAAH